MSEGMEVEYCLYLCLFWLGIVISQFYLDDRWREGSMST